MKEAFFKGGVSPKEDSMDDKCIFNCEVCGKETETIKTDSPECCGKLMKEKTGNPLPACELSGTAEHARLDDDFGEPCDDGRAGGS